MNNEQAKQEIKKHLLDYINDTGRELNRHGNFRCFNSSVHSHGDKTPSAAIVPGTNNEGWKCFACGAAGDIFTAVKYQEGKQFGEALEYLEDKYSISIDKSNSHNKGQQQNNAGVSRSVPEEKPKRQYDFTSLIEQAHSNVGHTDYFKKRGFSQQLIDKYRLGFLPNGHSKYGSGYKMSVPVSKGFVIFRHDGECDKKDRYRNEGNTEILNRRYLEDPSLTGKFIFVVEGWADALSLEEIGEKSIALNSTSSVNEFLNLARENKSNIRNKVFVISCDNDEQGQDAKKKITDGLNGLNLNVEAFEMPSEYKDANEYLGSDREGFKRHIQDFKSGIVDKDFTITYVEDFINQIEKQKEKKAIATGFKELDRKLGGGLYSGLYILGAISSLGKTTFVLQMADNIAESGQDVLFFSLEMSKFEIVSKSLSREMFVLDESAGKSNSVGTRDVMNGKADFELMARAFNKYSISGKHMGVIEGAFETDIQEIKSRIDQHMFLRETKPVVIVDYLQILKPSDVRMSDKQATDYNITQLKRMSRDYDIPVIVISSLNRQNYLTPISYESFKESGAVEYTADVLIGLQLEGMDEIASLKKITEQRERLNELKAADPRAIELVCLKNRNGIPYFTHWYDYYPKFNYFEEKN